MLGQLALGPRHGGSLAAAPPCSWDPLRRRRGPAFCVTAAFNNHYAVLGVSRSASCSDIKKAYRILAREWHPDVSKDSRAGEVFKKIHLAYQVLSNEATRVQYDRDLKSQEQPIKRNIYGDPEFEDEIRIHWWSELRRRKRKERYQERYNDNGRVNFSFYTESEEETDDATSAEERGSFVEVLLSVLLSLFLTQAVGCQLTLMFNGVKAVYDRKLDTGYKMGHLIALLLGGTGGVLLSICLSFASWACGKDSSGTVALVVVAMWVGSNMLAYVQVPQGAVLALLYMSLRLQADLN